MSTQNNSGNNSSGGTIILTGAGGGGGGGNNCAGSGTGAANGGWFTVTVPNNAVFTGGTITWNPGTGISIGDIELAVPVDEKKKKSDGCSCKKCKEFFEYAEPNQEDGTLICWACRHGY